MSRRRTTGVQRRTRASDEALNARVGASSTRRGVDVRLLALGGVLALGAILVGVFLLFGNRDEPVGQVVPNAGREHVDPGAQVPPGSYSSVPGTSGPHWNAPANWGVYPGVAGPSVPEAQAIHNLEHGGVVIWYQPGQVDQATIDALADYVNEQVATPRFKFILSPWTGSDFGHPVAVTAWTRLLYLDCAGAEAEATATASASAAATAGATPDAPPAASATPAAAPEACEIDMGRVREFADRYLGRLGPEPAGGPGPPAG